MREDVISQDAQTESRLSLTRRNFLQRGGVPAIGLTVLRSVDSSDAYAEPTGSDVSSALAQTARDAVIFGIPVLLQSRYLKRVLKAALTFNRFALDVDLSTPTTKTLGPNRYYCIQLVDMWSNSFAYIGSRATGEQGGAFALLRLAGAAGCPAAFERLRRRRNEYFLFHARLSEMSTTSKLPAAFKPVGRPGLWRSTRMIVSIRIRLTISSHWTRSPLLISQVQIFRYTRRSMHLSMSTRRLRKTPPMRACFGRSASMYSITSQSRSSTRTSY